MEKEYIDKLIEIGKKESCTDQEFSYFLTNLPDVMNRELLFVLRREYKIDTLLTTKQGISRIDPVIYANALTDEEEKLVAFIVDLIKGIHIIMFRNRMARASTTIISNLFGTLIQKDKKAFIDLYNWIAFNGGNYYIPENSLFTGETVNQREARYKQEEEERQRYENIHIKAEARKKQNRDNHLLKSKEKNEIRDLEIEKMNQLDKLQQLKSIANSSYPLDFYPEEFSTINITIIERLSLEEAQNLKEKLKSIKKKGPWKSIAKLLLSNSQQ